jgi:DNA primase catalytic core
MAASAQEAPTASDLLAVMETATRIWIGHARCASSYLGRRGLTRVAEDPSAFGVGYALARRSALVDDLRSSGFSDEQIVGAGLALHDRNGRLADRFRGRVMFPIHADDSGLAVGAIGRDITGHLGVPKYLNTPTTAIFRKGETLYGLAEQLAALAGGAIPMIVEGPLDVLSLRMRRHDVAPIATCGTALTPGQVERITAAATGSMVILAFDGDAAGGLALIRAEPLLRPHFGKVRLLPIEYGRDPASATSIDRSTPLCGLPHARDVIRAALACRPSRR